MVRNHLCKEEEQLSSSYRFWPGFVSLIEPNSEGEISCAHAQLKAQDLSFPKSTHAGNLELIWSVNQSQNRSNILQDRNPAQSEFEEVLDQQLKSILSELLGHERGHKYLSYHGFKSHPKHPLVLLLTSGKDGFNSLWTGFQLVVQSDVFLGFCLSLLQIDLNLIISSTIRRLTTHLKVSLVLVRCHKQDQTL